MQTSAPATRCQVLVISGRRSSRQRIGLSPTDRVLPERSIARKLASGTNSVSAWPSTANAGMGSRGVVRLAIAALVGWRYTDAAHMHEEGKAADQPPAA